MPDDGTRTSSDRRSRRHWLAWPVAGLLGAAALSAVAVAPTQAAAATCADKPATIEGNGTGATLTGTQGPDVIVSNGAQRVYGDGGDDTICLTGQLLENHQYIASGGAGEDLISDEMTMAGGDDRTYGDLLVFLDDTSSDAGTDTFVGGPAPEKVFTDAGTDQISTGGGDDLLVTRDVLASADLGAGDDESYFLLDVAPPESGRVVGGSGDDVLRVEYYADNRKFRLDLSDGSLTLPGVAGASTFESFESFRAVGHAVTVAGTSGRDRISVAACDLGVAADAGNDLVTIARIDPDDEWCDDYEARVGAGSGADVVTSTFPRGARLVGGAGADRLRTYWSATLVGGSGADTLRGGPKNDVLRGGTGNDVLYGNQGTDDLVGAQGKDSARGGAGKDRCRAETRLQCER